MNPAQPSLIDQAVELAAQWQNRANQLQTGEEIRLQRQMQRLLAHPYDKILLCRILDQSFRSHSPRRIADQLGHLLRTYGAPQFFNHAEKLFFHLFRHANTHLASWFIPRLIAQMRRSSSHVIIAGETQALQTHLLQRKQQGVRININHLGEAVLGESETARRMATYLKDLEDPAIEYISIKISTLYSQISSLAFDETVAILTERLSTVYRAAKNNHFTRQDGSETAKFVNLDMEEYRDLDITYRAFIATLDQEEFLHFSAGIVLQAYLPDSFAIQQQLTSWATARLARGGAPIKLRIVKGANMEMERLESALNNWPLAPYDNKLEVDANYKRMVTFGMQPDHIHAVHLGIASHNLFDLAYAAVLARHNNVSPYFCFEMLEGMANHVCRALLETGSDVLLYAPVAAANEFINAIAYLVRRLDENTGPENFLRAAPHLRVGSEQWTMLQESFRRSCALQETAKTSPNRIQDRSTECFPSEKFLLRQGSFINEADTDWSLAANRHWAKAIRSRWMKRAGSEPIEIPLVIDGERLFSGRSLSECRDPNQEKVLVGRYAMATADDAQRALQTAATDPEGWRNLSVQERRSILDRVAEELRKERGNLIGAACADTGKIFAEADAEVSEAIDFARFYPHSVAMLGQYPNLRLHGKGAVLVIAPWNFPIAIPCGGIAAALAAGNTVIFKPSSEAVLTGWMLCQCFWRAGISPKALQFIPCSGAEVGPLLIASPLVSSIILTGGTETGLQILARAPKSFLAAETGGKNATIVTDMADHDQAIKNVLHSAFSNCGQKCSATSLLILEKSVYDDPHFRRQLVDAAASLKVGPAWQFANKLGPLIRPPSASLLRGLTTLEAGEEWALPPAMVDGNPLLWSPGIKYGVQPGSFTHLAELFGPVLGVMRAENLDAAIELANQTGYGLTSGLESLDPREHDRWQQRIHAGNLYINRGTTGAMVLRQPFGGWGKSALGSGLKTGGPDYVTQFLDIEEIGPPQIETVSAEHRLLRLAQEWRIQLQWQQWPAEMQTDIDQICNALPSYLLQMATRFGRERDFFHLRGQDNFLRYQPIRKIVIRMHRDDSLFSVLARCAAALIAGCADAVLSLPPDLTNPIATFLASHHGRRFLDGLPILRQSDAELAASIPSIERLRYAAPDRVPAEIFAAAAQTGVSIARTPVLMEGRIELLHYFRQQSLCHTYHRYGNLGDRGLD